MATTRFRGAVVASPWTRGSFWDHVDVGEEQIHMHPWLRKPTVIERDRTSAVEFEKDQRPLIWATNVRFLRSDGTAAPKLFVPFRTRKLRLTLDALSWPTTDRQSR